MARYSVRLGRLRTVYQLVIVEVEGPDEQTARREALDMADVGDLDWWDKEWSEPDGGEAEVESVELIPEDV